MSARRPTARMVRAARWSPTLQGVLLLAGCCGLSLVGQAQAHEPPPAAVGAAASPELAAKGGGPKSGHAKGRKKKKGKSKGAKHSVVVLAGPHLTPNVFKEIRETDDPEGGSESLYSDVGAAEQDDPYTRFSVGYGGSVAVYVPGVFKGKARVIAPGIRYTYGQQRFEGRERTATVQEEGALTATTVQDQAEYLGTRQTLTIGVGLNIAETKKGKLGVFAPIEGGMSWGEVEASVDSRPGSPLRSRYSGGAFNFGVGLNWRPTDHLYVVVPLIMAHLAVGKIKDGDGLPFRDNANINLSYLPVGVRLGVGF